MCIEVAGLRLQGVEVKSWNNRDLGSVMTEHGPRAADVHSLHYDVNGDVVGFEWAFRDADINDRLPLPIRPDLSSTAPTNSR
jgi:hypothetical protein